MRGHGGQLTWLALAAASLMLPPLAGLALAGRPLAPYLEFPPRTYPVVQPGFSWPVFGALAALVVAAVAPLVSIGLQRQPRAVATPAAGRFPWWGWAGVALIAVFWPLAWTRLPWFADWQHHTFTPLWLGYILTVNGLLARRARWSLITHHPGFLLGSFVASVAYWWYFELANRIVGNWHYRGVEHFGTAEYVVLASVSFSTVLPAFTTTFAWLATFPRLAQPFVGLRPLMLAHPRAAGVALWLVAVLGLAGLGRWPETLYPLVWVAPLLVLIGLRAAFGRPTVLAPLAAGDYRPLALAPLAALACGLFWEMWNWRSLARWEYTVPYVDRWHLFEMPALGYAGYLPFGLECLAIAMLLPGAPAALDRVLAPAEAREAA